MRQSGGYPFDPKELSRSLQRVVEGKLYMMEYPTVDLFTNPFIPEGWKLEEHKRGGKWKFDPTKIILHLDEGQKNGGSIKGNKLRKKLKTKDVFNANLLDFYLAHLELIPENWKGKAIFFWGTIYRDAGDRLYVRYLCWDDDRWHWNFRWLGHDWRSGNSSAVLGK